eukprot:5361686-Pleurochrysis_carterae.AAC.1
MTQALALVYRNVQGGHLDRLEEGKAHQVRGEGRAEVDEGPLAPNVKARSESSGQPDDLRAADGAPCKIDGVGNATL